MQSSLRSTATLFVINIITTLFLIPRPVSSFPVVALKCSADWGSRACGPSRVNGELIFDLAFAFALLVALLCTWLWVARRTAVAFPVSRTNFLAPSISTQRLPSFRFGTFLRMVTLSTFGVGDGGRATTRPQGGLSPPISSVSLVRPQNLRVRFVSSSATRVGASHTVERNLRAVQASLV